jgi:hypothetical protein
MLAPNVAITAISRTKTASAQARNIVGHPHSRTNHPRAANIRDIFFVLRCGSEFDLATCAT